MSAVEQEIVKRLHNMSPDEQRRVLDFIDSMKRPTHPTYTASELMKLPAAERDRLVDEAFDRAAHEDFETFEA